MKFNMQLVMVFVVSLGLAGCVMPPDIHIPAKRPPISANLQHPRVVLVLGSGGARGYAHIGVLTVLQREHIPIDLVVGASVGSVIGALYADHADAFWVKKVMMNAGFFDFVDFAFLPPLRAPITGNRLQHFLNDHMRAKWFKDLKIPLVTVSSDLVSGEPFVIASGPIPPAVNASAALPGAARPVHIYGHTLVDGAMVGPVPTRIAKRFHPKVIIAVNIDQDLTDIMPNNMFGVYIRAFEISWNQLADVDAQLADVVIHPRLRRGGTFEIENKELFFNEGVRAAREVLPKIKALLAKVG